MDSSGIARPTQRGLQRCPQRAPPAGRIAQAIPLLEEASRASKQYPALGTFNALLLDAYTKAADPTKPESIAKVTKLMQETLAEARAALPKDSPELAGQLAAFSMTLLSLKAWDEAEPLLLDGYKGMKEREAAIPPQAKALRIPDALERLVKLYEAKGNQPEAAAWRGRLEEAKALQTKPDANGDK